MAAARWPFPSVAGFASLAAYLAALAVALLRFPGPFSPLARPLADLGDPVADPAGWVAFRIGVGVAGAALLVFNLALAWGARVEPRRFRAGLTGLTALGGFGSLGLVVTAVGDAGAGAWSAVTLLALGLVAGLTGLVLYRRPGFWRPLTGLGAAVVAGAVAAVAVPAVPALGALATGLLLAFIGLVAANLRAMPGPPIGGAPGSRPRKGRRRSTVPEAVAPVPRASPPGVPAR